jgi:branched-subunit amino acid aminotransferase/4-amino-4-deoxychorismate lyase
MSQVVFLNGSFLPAVEAQISVWDGGWLHGAGLFETMRARYGRIFRLGAHLDRLMGSAQKLLFPLERSDLPLTSDFAALLERNELTDARVRLTMTAGPMIDRDSGDSPPENDHPGLTVCATVTPFAPYPRQFAQQGMTVAISLFKVSPDDPLAGHKCTSYLPRLLALRYAHARQCHEALWFTTGNVLSEGSISNVFVVRAGRLQTPPLDTPVLPGITRAAVLELAKAAGLEADEKPLTINDLLDADEVFLTNSIMEVMPVCRVEKREIGNGQPGPVTKRMREDDQSLVEKECKADE